MGTALILRDHPLGLPKVVSVKTVIMINIIVLNKEAQYSP